MKITRFAIRFTNSDGIVDWHAQGLPTGDYDSFAFAILYATHEHAEKAMKKAVRKYPGLATTYFKVEIVPVTVEVNV